MNKVKSLFQRVYFWMFVGLLVSGIAAYITVSTPLIYFLLTNMILFIGIVIVELILVVIISGMTTRLSANGAKIAFILFSILNGITISLILLVYVFSSVVMVFFIAAAMFGALALYGVFTKKDLSQYGAILFMALIGLILSMVVNMFLKSQGFDLVISIIGVIIFSALIAYDNNKLKKIAKSMTNEKQLDRYSIIASLSLYLDFVNLFLFLLRLLGKRRR